MTTAFESYDAQRDTLRLWVRDHYINTFRLDPCRMLDAGCGNGFWAQLFKDAGFDVVGCDLSEEYIAEARRRSPLIPFVVADLTQTLPYAPKSFPLIFCRTISPFYSETLDVATDIVRRLLEHLTPSGALLLSMYTDGSNSWRPALTPGQRAFHHDRSSYLGMAATAGGQVTKYTLAGNYFQVLVRARHERA